MGQATAKGAAGSVGKLLHKVPTWGWLLGGAGALLLISRGSGGGAPATPLTAQAPGAANVPVVYSGLDNGAPAGYAPVSGAAAAGIAPGAGWGWYGPADSGSLPRQGGDTAPAAAPTVATAAASSAPASARAAIPEGPRPPVASVSQIPGYVQVQDTGNSQIAIHNRGIEAQLAAPIGSPGGFPDLKAWSSARSALLAAGAGG